MASIAELNARRDAILKNLGVTDQKYGDRSVSYAGPEDMVTALKLLDDEIARLGGETTPPRTKQIRMRQSSKGY